MLDSKEVHLLLRVRVRVNVKVRVRVKVKVRQGDVSDDCSIIIR